MRCLPFFFDLTYEIVTPLFMSGVDQTKPQLRPPSIRGAVRAWYRAIEPRFQEMERRAFGGAFDEGDGASNQGLFRLQVLSPPSGEPFELEPFEWKHFNYGNVPLRTNGVMYTGFSLLSRFNKRMAFPVGPKERPNTFTLRMVFPRLDDKTDLRLLHGILGSFWLLGHLGALGSRANRCWGSVQLTGLKVGGLDVPKTIRELVELYRPAETVGPGRWAGEVAGMLLDLQDRLGGTRVGTAGLPPHIGPKSVALISTQAERSWGHAVDQVGANLQLFRRDKGMEDRRMVLSQLLTRASEPRVKRMGKDVPTVPGRTAFGLPLTFRFGLTPKWLRDNGVRNVRPESLTFSPDGMQRHASPLRLRIVRLKGGWYPVVVRLSGAPVGSVPDDSGAEELRIVGEVAENNRAQPKLIGPYSRLSPQDQMLEAYMEQLVPHTYKIPVPQ